MLPYVGWFIVGLLLFLYVTTSWHALFHKMRVKRYSIPFQTQSQIFHKDTSNKPHPRVQVHSLRATEDP
jgi:hypothetical protein